MQIRFGEFIFDGVRRMVTRRGAVIPLAPKAFDLLQILIDERPRAVPKQELCDRLWPDVVVQEANLKNLVGEIRTALGDDSVVRTVPRFGYAFAAESTAPQKTRAARLIIGHRIHRLNEGENVIGRDDDCAVILDFSGVSRRHARIMVDGNRYTLEDLGSKNGTFQNDIPVAATAVELRDGDRIRIGAVSLTFRSNMRPSTTVSLS